ncbi:hypothetical protein PAECIP111893_00550 [Paenibacillus plantiphilus]|uniref:Uncharacterized protein n=1 Tax=Paenibacillus plantiphilus TaxID=2905650 RepID=A0ABN8G2P8_9BACL|nr:hypothetical protein PAECIP111893_00550 [Paenibacillus plantiphilus]
MNRYGRIYNIVKVPDSHCPTGPTGTEQLFKQRHALGLLQNLL